MMLLVAGDSILKGIQIDGQSGRYIVRNTIDYEKASAMKTKNISSFGCTVSKGLRNISYALVRTQEKAIVLMDFGGNDCDYEWQKVSEYPDLCHIPRTPMPEFQRLYGKLIETVREYDCIPVVTTLPPIDSERYFNWISILDGVCKDALMQWMGTPDFLGEWQSYYSEAASYIANRYNADLIDLREHFRKSGQDNLFCQDGIHPNDNGQRLIEQCLSDYFKHLTTQS